MGTRVNQFEAQIGALDIRLFDKIYSQLYEEDKSSLLLIQKGIRQKIGDYVYLEIGSYAGGSIQPHLLDPKCVRIYSIDNRPLVPPDDRGIVQEYPENSTEMMMKKLAELSPLDLSKIKTFEKDASQIEALSIEPRPQLCLIDGEHTHKAALSDFTLCRTVLAPNGIICFHDSHIIFTALKQIIDDLHRAGVSFRAFVLPLNVFVMEFGDIRLTDMPETRRLLDNNHVAYLSGMLSMEHYREVYNSPVVKTLRRIKGILR